jgi:lipid kinase YegS
MAAKYPGKEGFQGGGRGLTRLCIIVHAGDASDPGLHEAVRGARQQGHSIDLRVAAKPGDTARLVGAALAEAGRGEIDCIVAGGGDGTVNQVLAAAHGQGLPPNCSLGVLPLGTANDFARSAGIPADDLEAALAIATSAAPRWIDAGDMDGRLFVNLLSGGFGARITAETDPKLKDQLGGLAYALTGVARFAELSANRGRFRAEGFAWEGDFVAVAIGNGRHAGGGIELCPDAVLDDGLLDLTIVPTLDRTRPLEALGNLLRRGTQGLVSTLPTARSAWIEYESAQDLNVNLDGEPMVLKAFRVEARPRALPIRLGETAALG